MRDRFDAPHGWVKNPDCDLHGSVDLMTANVDGVTHAIDVHHSPAGGYSVALDAGLDTRFTHMPARGTQAATDYPSMQVDTPEDAQRAIDLFAALVCHR